MSELAPVPQDSPPKDTARDLAIARAGWRLAVLEEMAEFGMRRIRELEPAPVVDALPADAAPAAAADPVDAFARYSRAVRLAVAQHARVDQALCDLLAGVVRAREAEKAEAAERAGEQARKVREDHRERISAAVLCVAESECETGDAFGEVWAALDERLAEDEAYIDLGDQPFRETVERLCHDLCLHPDWSRWDGEGWMEEADSRQRVRFSRFNTPSPRPIPADPSRLRQIAPPLARPRHLATSRALE